MKISWYKASTHTQNGGSFSLGLTPQFHSASASNSVVASFADSASIDASFVSAYVLSMYHYIASSTNLFVYLIRIDLYTSFDELVIEMDLCEYRVKGNGDRPCRIF